MAQQSPLMPTWVLFAAWGGWEGGRQGGAQLQGAIWGQALQRAAGQAAEWWWEGEV